MDMSFQPAFNARLIAEVKKHPCLYNHSKRGSGDTNERMKIWEQIAADVDVNCTGEFAKKRWLQLRDRYRKELKVAIRQNFSTPVRWCYFSHLSWLDPYLKDNLALANACEAMTDIDYKDLSSLAQIRNDMDDGIDDMEPTSISFESSLDRLLAATHRHESTSPILENDDSGPQSVGTSGDEDRLEVAVTNDSSDDKEIDNQTDAVLQVLQPPSNFSIKDQFLARHVQQQQMAKSVLQTSTRSAIDWMNDEDMLYSRIIGLRLKKMDSKRRKRVRDKILSLLDDEEDEGELPTKLIKDETSSENGKAGSPLSVV